MPEQGLMTYLPYKPKMSSNQDLSMSEPKTGAPKFRKKSPRFSIRLDRVHPGDFNRMNLIYACEHCSHYDAVKKFCSMGFQPQFTEAHQRELYDRTGAMAFCRFLEID
mgnify:CR=1 FL=1